jgi:hypothetical protein
VAKSDLDLVLLVVFLGSHLWSSGQSSWLQVPGSIPGTARFSEKSGKGST